MVCNINVSVSSTIPDILPLLQTVYVTASDIEKSSSFNKTDEITSHVRCTVRFTCRPKHIVVDIGTIYFPSKRDLHGHALKAIGIGATLHATFPL